MDKIFKQLVIGSVLLHTLLWFSPYFSYLWMDDGMLEMLVSAGGYGAILPYDEYARFFMLYDVVVYFGFVLSSIGMLFFYNSARVIFTLLIAVSLVFILFSGMVVSIEGDAFLGEILSLLDGAILALAYLTPLSKKFTWSRTSR